MVQSKNCLTVWALPYINIPRVLRTPCTPLDPPLSPAIAATLIYYTRISKVFIRQSLIESLPLHFPLLKIVAYIHSDSSFSICVFQCSCKPAVASSIIVVFHDLRNREFCVLLSLYGLAGLRE